MKDFVKSPLFFVLLAVEYGEKIRGGVKIEEKMTS